MRFVSGGDEWGDERPLMRAGVEVRSTGNLRGMGTNNLQHRGGYLVS